jgi:RNA polymerase sigma factor (sigma-70 family)
MEDSGSAQQTRPSLLVRLRDGGNAGAWRTFVDIYAPLVYGFARRQGLQDADAADVTQDVMVEVARSIRSFEYRPERGRFRDWLLLITRRRLVRFFNRRARRVDAPDQAEVVEPAVDQTPDPAWLEAFNNRILESAMTRIRPHFEPWTWRAFECVWLENKTAAETAELLSIRIHAVYVAKSRVLKRLKEEVRDIVEDFTWLDALGGIESARGTAVAGPVAPDREQDRRP